MFFSEFLIKEEWKNCVSMYVIHNNQMLRQLDNFVMVHRFLLFGVFFKVYVEYNLLLLRL